MNPFLEKGKKNIIGPQVREARIKAGLTPDELVARLNDAGMPISRRVLDAIEIQTKKVPDIAVAYFCETLDVSVDYLLGKKDTF